MAETSNVTITLTSDEALVLFELLHRWEDADVVSPPQHEPPTATTHVTRRSS